MFAMTIEKHPDDLLERFRVLAEQESCRQRAVATLNLAEKHKRDNLTEDNPPAGLGPVASLLTTNPDSFPGAGLSALLRSGLSPDDDAPLRDLAKKFVEAITSGLNDQASAKKEAPNIVGRMNWTLDQLRPLAEVYEALVAPDYVWTGSTPWRRDS